MYEVIKNRRDEVSKIFKLNHKEIIDLYVNKGLNHKEIGRKFNLCYGSVRLFLIKNNVIMRSRCFHRKHKVDSHYFEKINSKEKAYFLGWLFSDGCNYTPRNMVSIGLKEGDIKVLQRFKAALKTTADVKIYKRPENGISKKGSRFASLSIGDERLSKDLVSLGMVNKKSLILKFPQLASEFIPAFLRGYLEGDGCILISKPSQKNRNLKFSCTFLATKEFGQELQNYLHKTLDLKLNIDRKKDWADRNINMYRLTTSNKREVLSILNLLYDGCGDLFLDRKYKIYKKMLDYMETYNFKSITIPKKHTTF